MIESTQFEKLSTEKIIELIKKMRDDLINHFFIVDNLESYFKSKYEKPLSDIKREFLLRDLKALMTSPVDLVHYATLIKEIKQGSSSNPVNAKDELFYKELELIFDKYTY